MKKFGICLVALTLAVLLAAPAMAELDPYASMRLSTFWVTHSPASGDDDSDLWMEVEDISRFGVKGKTGDLGGHVELGVTGAGNSGNAVVTRLFYGTYDFGGGTLKVGQDYSAYTLVSSQTAPRTVDTSTAVVDGENVMIGYGCLWDSRYPQIEVKMDNGFYVELIRPIVGTLGTDQDSTLPKTVVGYEAKMENLLLNVGAAYNSYEADEEDVTSYLIYCGGKADAGMANFQWNLHYGQNLTDFGIWNRETAAAAQVDASGNIEDSTSWGGYLQVAFNVDPATITIGYGYSQSENDELGGDADAQQTYFAQCKIPIADTFFIVPEISFYDGMEDAAGNEEDDEWALGMMWRMDF